jgi:hypothetical protein
MTQTVASHIHFLGATSRLRAFTTRHSCDENGSIPPVSVGGRARHTDITYHTLYQAINSFVDFLRFRNHQYGYSMRVGRQDPPNRGIYTKSKSMVPYSGRPQGWHQACIRHQWLRYTSLLILQFGNRR